MKLYYCPKCGRITKEDSYKIVNWCDCGRSVCILPGTKYLPMEEEYEDFDLDQPMDWFYFTKEMYDLAREKYVLAPGNKKLNLDKVNEFKAAKEEIFASGEDCNPRHEELDAYAEKMKRIHSFKAPPLKPGQCPCCLSMSVVTHTNDFDIPSAMVGNALFGEHAGLIAGIAGGGRVYNVCQKCGFEWEPGKW